MELDEGKRVQLRDYAALGDRDTEPVFVGRDSLFELVQGTGEIGRRPSRQGPDHLHLRPTGRRQNRLCRGVRETMPQRRLSKRPGLLRQGRGQGVPRPVAIMQACTRQIERFDKDWDRRTIGRTWGAERLA